MKRPARDCALHPSLGQATRIPNSYVLRSYPLLGTCKGGAAQIGSADKTAELRRPGRKALSTKVAEPIGARLEIGSDVGEPAAGDFDEFGTGGEPGIPTVVEGFLLSLGSYDGEGFGDSAAVVGHHGQVRNGCSEADGFLCAREPGSEFFLRDSVTTLASSGGNTQDGQFRAG